MSSHISGRGRAAYRASRRGAWAVLLWALLSGTGCGPTQESIKKQQEQADFHYQLAYGHYFDARNSSGDLALQEVLRSLEIHEASHDANILAGLIFMGRERHIDAVRHFERAIEIEPRSHIGRNNLGAAYLSMERWDDAIGVFDALVLDITNPTPGHAQNNLGWAWYKKGDLDRAERHFSSARSLSPKLCPAHNNLGIVYLERKQYHQALRALSVAIKQCPSYAEAYYHLGRGYQKTGEFVRAKEAFQQCVHWAQESIFEERCQAQLHALVAPGPPQGGPQ